MSSLGEIRTTNIRPDMGFPPERGEKVIRVDRQNIVLGNKDFLIAKNSKIEREKVLNKYRVKLDEDLLVKGLMYQELLKIAYEVYSGEKICMACWCSPLPCHADILVAEVRKMVQRMTDDKVPIMAKKRVLK